MTAILETSNMRGDRKRKKTMYKRGHIAQKKGEINKEADPHTPHSKSNYVKYHRFDYEQFNPLTANDEISRRVIKTPRLPTSRYFVAFFMSQNCQRRDISPTLRQNGTRQHRSSKATGDRKCLTIHVTHSFLISIKTNNLFFDMIIYFNVVNYE